MDVQYGGEGSRLRGMLRSNAEIVAIGILVLFYLFIANFFTWSVAFENGTLNVSGGSDPYYNYRIIEYILSYHHQLLFDPALNYPLGSANPRNPFFHWFIVFAAEVLSPIFGVQNAAYYAFNEFDAFFGALLIIPVYLMTKEIFGKKAGIVAAVLYTLMPSNLSSGILSDGRMHTPELIFAFLTIYFFERAIKLAGKNRIIDNLFNFRSYISSIKTYYQNNRLPTVYALLSAASLGGLMLSWQGYPYIEVIILLYISVQLIMNLFTRKPTGYLTYYTIIFVLLSFLMGSYYYVGAHFVNVWYNDPFYMGLMIIGLGILFNIAGRRPWIITIPTIVILAVLALVAIDIVAPSILHELLSGQGYFIKNRVYATIAEAQSPPLGQYISGFGAAQFLLGLSGIAYIIYRYSKEKKEHFLLIIVFSLVSIYMSLAAARFNVTAAPAYALLGAGMLVYFADMLKLDTIKKRKPHAQVSVTKAIKGNISFVHSIFVGVVVLLIIIPSGLGIISASIPVNNAASINDQIHNSLPSFLKVSNYSSSNLQYVGGNGIFISNSSQPLALSYSWLSSQDSNLPLDQRPAYVSWWDYGFQQLYQGQHPTVADDFQQGYQVAGQILLAQNESQIISLFMARVLQGAFSEGHGYLTPSMNQTLNYYFGSNETALLYSIYKDPSKYTPLIQQNPNEYGNFIPTISSSNAYFALVKGQLSYNYPTSTIVNAYQELTQESGYDIKYVQIDSQLFPFSGTNPGIFYAPTYLTDTPSYNYEGQIIPTNYYQIVAVTYNGTFPLNQLPSGVQPISYQIQYTPAFYNTSIYRFMIGMPPSATGNTGGLPTISYDQQNLQIMPAWNMSHFELSYEAIPWNPYVDYQNHPTAWQLISLQQAYTYNAEHKGIAIIFPPSSQFLTSANPIVSYYPGAKVSGQVTLPDGTPVQGLYVTIFDQYGVPHQYTQTNKNGFYNLTGLPGNDTIFITSGTFQPLYLQGSNSIATISLQVSNDQAERIPVSYNTTTGLPSYYIQKNYVIKSTKVSGNAAFVYQQVPEPTVGNTTDISQTKIMSGEVVFHNSQYNLTYTSPIINGNYKFNNMLPYSYEASVITNGKEYKNVQIINTTVGGDLVYNLQVPFNTLFVNVSLGNVLLPGYTVKITGNGITETNVTNSTGGAKLWIEPGDYTIYAYNDNSISLEKSVSFSTWGNNQSLNLTPTLSATVSGQVLNQQGITNLKFFENGFMNSSLSTQTDSSGAFSITLPYGLYTIYAQQNGKTILKTINVTNNLFENLSFEAANNLSITSHTNKQGVYSGFYEVISQNALLRYDFVTDRNVQLEVPNGSYTISGYGTFAGNIVTGFKYLTIVSDTSVNLSLTQNNSVAYALVYNSNAGGFNANSAITTGVVEIGYPNFPMFYQTVNNNGVALLYYENISGERPTATYYSPYYTTAPRTVTGDNVNLPLNPVMTNIKITLANSTYGVNISGTVQLLGLNDYNLTMTDGTASGSVQPGIYYIKVSNPSVYLTPNVPSLAVPIVSSASFTKDVGLSATISVPSSTQYSIYDMAGNKLSTNKPLPLGHYTVYSVNASLGVNVTTINLLSNTALDPTYSSFAYLNLSNSLGASGGTYTVSSEGYLIKTAENQLALPSGNYEIYYSQKVANSSGAFVINGSTSVSLVSGNNSVNVPVVSQEVLSSITGYATLNGAPSQYSFVELLDSKGNVLSTTYTNSAGYYSLTSSYGDYSLYVINNASSTGYFGSLTVPAFQTSVVNNVSMVSAYKTYVSVNVLNQLINTNVTISDGINLLLFNSSRGSLSLPIGNYTFSASVSKSEQIYNGTNISVEYGTNYTTSVNKISYIPITLEKSDIYGFVFTQLSTVATINGGQNFTYAFSLLNSGNTEVNVSLSSGNGSWSMKFNRSAFDLMPGQSVDVSANISNISSVPSGLNQIPITLSYNSKTTNEYLSVNVNSTEKFDVQAGPMGVPDGKIIKMPFTITNIGNSPVVVNLSITDESLLNLSFWKASFTYDGVNVSSITVPYGQTLTVYVTLTPTGPNPNPSVLFQTSFISVNQNITKNVTLQYPSLSKLYPYPTGNDIIGNYTGNPIYTVEIGVIAIVAIVLVGLVIVSIRSRKKK